ncbi:MAG: hypothetical protein Q8L57_02220, partial [bacterium]|nr:hypothetical protein [bacterium]
KSAAGIDYQINIELSSGEKIILGGLGYQYEDFLKILIANLNKALLKDMLVEEGSKKLSIDARVKSEKWGNQAIACEAQFYETMIVVVPDNGMIAKIPLGEIISLREKDHIFDIVTEGEGSFEFSLMGEKFDLFVEKISEAMNNLSITSQGYLKEIFPGLDIETLRKITAILRDGRAAKRQEIESVSPDLWKKMEEKIKAMGIKEEYDFLAALSLPEKICIGIKRGLMGGMTGDYIWFLIPVLKNNAIAMEATSQNGKGRATYFFRIMPRAEYAKNPDMAQMGKLAEELITRINKAMIKTEFRRQPIYLPAEKLDDPKYKNYKFAIEKFPELKELRRLFVGRVMHYSQEQWESDVNDILKFNVSTQDDDARWAKTDITDIGEEESKPAALEEEGGVSGPEEQESEERKEENNVGDGNN